MRGSLSRGRWRRQTQSGRWWSILGCGPPVEERLPLHAIEWDKAAFLVRDHASELSETKVHGPALKGGELVGGALVDVLCHGFSISKSELLVKAEGPGREAVSYKMQKTGWCYGMGRGAFVAQKRSWGLDFWGGRGRDHISAIFARR